MAGTRSPNNPTRTDGPVHQYAPPEQVDSEIANLLQWYEDYEATVHPVLTAAWLHHRFVQILPFADGNGRTARALMNWHLIRHGYLPIAVTSKDRPGYIHALAQADGGDLSILVDRLCGLTRSMIRIVVNDAGEASAILGPPLPPDHMTMDDYPGLRRQR